MDGVLVMGERDSSRYYLFDMGGKQVGSMRPGKFVAPRDGAELAMGNFEVEVSNAVAWDAYASGTVFTESADFAANAAAAAHVTASVSIGGGGLGGGGSSGGGGSGGSGGGGAPYGKFKSLTSTTSTLSKKRPRAKAPLLSPASGPADSRAPNADPSALGHGGLTDGSGLTGRDGFANEGSNLTGGSGLSGGSGLTGRDGFGAVQPMRRNTGARICISGPKTKAKVGPKVVTKPLDLSTKPDPGLRTLVGLLRPHQVEAVEFLWKALAQPSGVAQANVTGAIL